MSKDVLCRPRTHRQTHTQVNTEDTSSRIGPIRPQVKSGSIFSIHKLCFVFVPLVTAQNVDILPLVIDPSYYIPLFARYVDMLPLAITPYVDIFQLVIAPHVDFYEGISDPLDAHLHCTLCIRSPVRRARLKWDQN